MSQKSHVRGIMRLKALRGGGGSSLEWVFCTALQGMPLPSSLVDYTQPTHVLRTTLRNYCVVLRLFVSERDNALGLLINSSDAAGLQGVKRDGQ